MNRGKFAKLIWDFYQNNKRDLPWRNTTDPYRILVSEIMLQQTQVARVLVKYPEFVKKFPAFKSLNKNSIAEILTVWQGMGYNRRALYLKKIAEKVEKEYKGALPKDPKILQTFPGIGSATACSILVFSYNLPLVFIETNIRRVFIHHFFKDKKGIHDKELLPLVEQYLDRKNPREWHYALMDYGSHLGKTELNPNRRSTHYVKQSKFEGSLRQLRGEVLKVLLEFKTIPISSLKSQTKDPRLEKALNQLEKEGFLSISKNKISLVR